MPWATIDYTIWRSLVPAVTSRVVSTGMDEPSEFLVFVTPSSRPQLSKSTLAKFWDQASDRRRARYTQSRPVGLSQGPGHSITNHPLARPN